MIVVFILLPRVSQSFSHRANVKTNIDEGFCATHQRPRAQSSARDQQQLIDNRQDQMQREKSAKYNRLCG